MRSRNLTTEQLPCRHGGGKSTHLSPCVHACSSAVAFLLALFLLAAASPAAAVMDRASIDGMFKEGSELFRQANEAVGKNPDAAKDLYKKALMRFETIVRDGGIHNGALYYNIGNAYFRTEDLGRAVLNYRRAELYTPNDPNLRQNLDYARSKRLDKIDVREKTKVLETLFFWHYDLPSKTRALVFTTFFVLSWIFAFLRIFMKRPWIGWSLGLSVFLSVLFACSVSAEAWALQSRKSGVVVSNDVVARKGDSETYEPSFTEPLHAGTEFSIAEIRQDWYQVELADGRRCWIPTRSAELVQ